MDTASLRRVLLPAYEERSTGHADPVERQAERRRIGEAHEAVYEDLL
ncbi:hypothetical protein [Streptomyces sp. NPDC048565]